MTELTISYIFNFCLSFTVIVLTIRSWDNIKSMREIRKLAKENLELAEKKGFREGSLTSLPVHIVATLDSGKIQLYINGHQVNPSFSRGLTVGCWSVQGHIRHGFSSSTPMDLGGVQTIYAKDHKKILSEFG